MSMFEYNEFFDSSLLLPHRSVGLGSKRKIKVREV